MLTREGIRALGFVPLVADGKLLGTFMIYFDRPRELASHEVEIIGAIANHVAAAVARFAALEELEETLRLNERFAAILGHDLRNPLAAIMASAELAKRRDEEGRFSRPLTRILNSAARMGRMIDHLLDFARLRAGATVPLLTQNIDLMHLLEQTLGEIGAVHPEAKFDVVHRGDARGVWDDDRLCQILSNLLVNAVDHGTKEEDVRVVVDGCSSGEILVSIHNGGAIPGERLSRIFEPLRGSTERRPRAAGLGLGLFITREIAKAHGGSIDVHSTEPEGTTFTVRLPRQPPPRG